MIKDEKPMHLTQEQWDILKRARHLSDVAALIASKIDVHYNKSLVFGKKAESPYLMKLIDELNKADEKWRQFTSTQEYADARDADTA